MYFPEMYTIFSRELLSFFISLQNVGDLYAPPCITFILEGQKLLNRQKIHF